MNWKRCLVSFTLLLSLALPAQEVAGNKGRMKLIDYVIIVGDKPTAAENTAAAELAKYLGKVTGATFRAVTETPDANPAKGIYVGWTKFAAKNGIALQAFTPEEWYVRTVGDDLVMTGGRPRGTLNAVYAFLEEIVGVHVLDARTEVIPQLPSLTVNAPQLSGKPAFLYHGIIATSDFRTDWKEPSQYFQQFNQNDSTLPRPEYGLWRKIGAPAENHTFGFYIPSKEYGASHPEYFAMHKKADGTLYRNTDDKGVQQSWVDLCLSNQKVRQLVTEKLRAYIEADRKKAQELNVPPPFIYSIDQNDCLPGYGCLCPACRKIVEREDAESGLMIDFINEIADKIKGDFPDILLQTFAYNHTLKAPKTIRPRDNVMIRWCDSYGKSELIRPLTHPYNEQMRALFEPWARISKNMAVWDYWRYFQPHTPGFYAPFVNIACLKPDLEYFQANGVKSVFIENEDFAVTADNSYVDDIQSFAPLRLWLGMKLMQDPKRDMNTLLEIFFKGYYGAAAGKMRELLAYIEKRQEACKQKMVAMNREDYYKAYLDLEFFTISRKLLDEAETACGTDALSRAHVARERIPVDSALLHLEPALRKTFCSEGKPYPFDRAKVLTGYEAAWDLYLKAGMSSGETPANARTFVDKRLAYLRTMPMFTRDSIRHKATPVADGDIRIDGVLDEAAWKGVSQIFLSPYDKVQELKVKTIVRTIWSKEKLYVAFECFENHPAEMKFQLRKKDDPEVCLDNSIELFLSPGGGQGPYYQIIVNPAGAVADQKVLSQEGKKDFDFSWSSGAEVAVKVNNNSWVVEMAIPLKAINIEANEGGSFFANFCRSRCLKEDKSATQLQTWSPFLTGGFHEPDKFGSVILAGTDNDVLFTSFEGQQDMPNLTPTEGCVITFGKENASDGETSLRINFPKSTAPNRGVTVQAGTNADWSSFSKLKADIFVEGSAPLELITRLQSDKFAYSGLLLQPGWNKGVMLADLNAARKTIDLVAVKNFYLYAGQKFAENFVIYLDNIRLVPENVLKEKNNKEVTK